MTINISLVHQIYGIYVDWQIDNNYIKELGKDPHGITVFEEFFHKYAFRVVEVMYDNEKMLSIDFELQHFSLLNIIGITPVKVIVENISGAKIDDELNRLALNSPEIYALTIGLKLLAKDTVFEYPLEKVADKIYSQLSSFGKKMVNENAFKSGLSFEQTEMKFISSLEVARQNNRAFCNFLRDSRPCEVQYIKDGEPVTAKGTMHLATYASGKLDKVILRQGTIDELININDIEYILPL